MKKDYSEKLLIISLANIVSNYSSILNELGNKVTCGAVVKANAYGLGLKEVSLALYNSGCRSFFVADLDEGIYLRSLLKDIKIYVLFGVKKKEEKEFFINNLIPVLNTVEQIERWSLYSVLKGIKLKSIINFNTGMNRLGLDISDAESIKKEILDNLNIEVIMSHLSNSWDYKSESNSVQLKKFIKICKSFPNSLYSLSSSGGVFLGEDYHFDMVRVGISLYGVSFNSFKKPSLKNVVTLLSRIISIRKIDSKSSVGYGISCILPKGTLLAVIPIGYYDGYLNNPLNTYECLVKGVRVPVVGAISMNMTIIDITKLEDKNVQIGDEVELIGDNIKVSEFGLKDTNLSYRLMTSLKFKNNFIYE